MDPLSKYTWDQLFTGINQYEDRMRQIRAYLNVHRDKVPLTLKVNPGAILPVNNWYEEKLWGDYIRIGQKLKVLVVEVARRRTLIGGTA